MESEVIVVGAGIGGLTLACALEQKGISCQIYEQSESFEALGYGIQISPNAVRVLRELGLEKQLERVSHRCKGFELRSFNSDQVLANWQLDSNVPYYQCRRSSLHQLVFNGLEAKSKVNFGYKLVSCQPKDNHHFLTWQDGTTTTAKILVGADGVHSLVRQSLFGQNQAQYSGYAAYRAILPFQEKYLPFWGKATVWMGENHHVVVYPNGKEQNQNSWLNLVLVEKDQNWQQEGWKIPAEKKAIVKGFHNQSPQLNQILQDLLTTPEPCYKWGLFIHQPLPYWSKNNITLLGDSAHPMLPFQAQGAAMAIESAYILAQCLSKENDSETALRKYQQIRQPRARKVQQVSRNNANIFHATGAKAIIRNLALSLVSATVPYLLNQKTAWIYNYDPKSASN